MPVDLCVSNNADLYDAIFRAHGLTCSRTREVWSTEAKPPPYYSNLLLLEPAGAPALLSTARQLRQLKRQTITFKDGFSVIDGANESFDLLFSATWIMRQPARHESAPWTRIESASQLAAWERSWAATSPSSARVFPDRVLEDSALAFFGAEAADGFAGGCVVNQSLDCVGLSNVFGGSYADAVACAVSCAGGKPIVGYERGPDLDEALSAQFEAVGPLNIWMTG